jgi:hypothetical protein
VDPDLDPASASAASVSVVPETQLELQGAQEISKDL